MIEHGAQYHLVGVACGYGLLPGRGMVDNATAECNSNLVVGYAAVEAPVCIATF
jgi:hypothetical protein